MALPQPAADATCLITGASSGIGAEFARQLGARGHNLLLVARRRQRLQELADQIQTEHSVNVEVAECDLSDPLARGQLVEQTLSSAPRVQILINNAGFAHVGNVHEHPQRQLGMVQVNVEALVDLTGAFLPGMVQSGSGAVINVASMAAFQPLPIQATYAASKSFVLSFSEAISSEVARSGVTVTALCPGPVATEFVQVAQFKRTVEEMGPSFLWASAAATAKAGIEGAERSRRVVVPGSAQRLLAFTARHSPRALLLGPVAAAWRHLIGE